MLGNITVLQVENIKKIKYLDLKLDPKGELIKVEGPNDAGKSSLLDAIRYAFEGGEIPKDVITHGENKGTVRIETSGGWIITKTIRKNKKGEQVTELTVRNKDGFKEKAQTFLKEFSSKFIDPTKLIDMNPTDLSKAIFEIFKLDFVEIDNKLSQTKLDLKVIRKQLKELGAEPEKPEITEGIPNTEQIQAEYNEANKEFYEKKNEIDKINDRIELNKELVEQNKETIENLKQRIAQLEKANADMEEQVKKDIETLNGLQWVIGTLTAKIKKLEPQLKQINEYSELKTKLNLYNEWKKKKEYLDSSYEKLSKQQKQLEEQKKQLIKQLDLPIEITDDGIFYNGDRWENLSTSTKLTLAVNMAIKAIPDDGARILYMQRGESIGKEKLKEIIQKAYDNNIQIFMEVFRDDTEGIKIIKEGVEDEENFFDNSADDDLF